MNNNFIDNCYVDKNKKRTIFIPQEKVYIKSDIDPSIYFPNINNVNFKNLKISNIGLFSVAVPQLAENILKDMKQNIKNLNDLTITDAMANCGGMSIRFCENFKNVNCCDIIKEHCKILKNNLDTYKFKNYKIFCGDYMDSNFEEDIVFFDPPWGSNFWETTTLEMNNINILCIINNILTNKNTKYCVLLIPPAFDKNQIREFISKEIEYNISTISFINKNNKQKIKDIIYFTKQTSYSSKRIINMKYKLIKF